MKNIKAQVEFRNRRMKALKELEKTLMDFMYEYADLHQTLIVTQRGMLVTADECYVPCKLRD